MLRNRLCLILCNSKQWYKPSKYKYSSCPAVTVSLYVRRTHKPRSAAAAYFSTSSTGTTRGVPSGGSLPISLPMLVSSTIVKQGTSLNLPSLYECIFPQPSKKGNAIIAANSYTVAPSPSTRSNPANAVPPVAMRSSTSTTLSPALTDPRRITVSSVLYSVVYFPEEMRTPGSLPAFLIITNGILSAKAIGGPKINPRASNPAMCVGPLSPAARYRATSKSTTLWNASGLSVIPEIS
mmetsp:Transcript_29033/g.55712  ORF Transcript_29033/g.55712 Transcript_29033/m.55712 type:complete len:237 (+) Transcript_29033:115-825(+)